MGYLIPKPFLQKNSRNTTEPISGGGDKGIHTFSNDIILKMNFELKSRPQSNNKIFFRAMTNEFSSSTG